jgi:hypothetical protein
MRDLRETRRLLPASAGLLACCALALAVAGSAAAVQPASVGVTALRTDQAAILKTNRLKVRVESGAAGSVRVAPLASVAGAKAVRVGKSRRTRVTAGARRRMSLKLSRKGRRALASCTPIRLVFKARLRPAGSAGGPPAGTQKAVNVAPVTGRRKCSGPNPPPGVTPVDPGTPNGNVIPDPQPYSGPAIAGPGTNPARCDVLDKAICLQPWPNDYFTVEDTDTDTGRRLNLQTDSMPENVPLGLLPLLHIDPAEHNRNDGFSPGNLLVTKVPGLDNQQAFDNSGLVPIDAPERYDDPGQGVVVLNAETGERHPVWAEIDSNPPNPGNRNLIIRPLVNFEEGARYVVGLRGLKDAAGNPIEPADAFRAYRDNLITTEPAVEGRRPHMEELFEILGQAGIQRSGLYLAWDFTIASERNLSERMLKIRDAAFAGLGDTNLADGVIQGASPQFSIDGVTDLTPAQDARVAREVTGTVTVPCFMTLNCSATGARFNYAGSPDGLPVQAGTTNVPFTCEIPRAALDDPNSDPARPSLYGHGLLGAQGEVAGGNVKAMANEHNFVMCATDWYGFATQNLANILVILQDLSQFPLLADATQQGFLNFLFLGRAMAHPGGFVSNSAFQGADGDDAGTDPDPLLDTGELYYDGNSQGGILGGGLTAVAPDFRQAVLGVPGMNYSTLLERSVDFEPYAEGQFGEVLEGAICDQANSIPVPQLAAIVVALCVAGVPDDTPLGLYDNYPNEMERPLIFSLMQNLWDRAEANGYAQHMTTDPLPNTPAHDVLLHAAYGDHQVANVTAEVEARTIGASVYQPALDPGRHWQQAGSDPIFRIPAIPSFPFGGSALVYWDGGPMGFPGGTEVPPDENIPPRPPTYGVDPHSYPRNDIKARAQKAAFLSPGGQLLNYCTAQNNPLADPALLTTGGTPTPCYAHGYTGP